MKSEISEKERKLGFVQESERERCGTQKRAMVKVQTKADDVLNNIILILIQFLIPTTLFGILSLYFHIIPLSPPLLFVFFFLNLVTIIIIYNTVIYTTTNNLFYKIEIHSIFPSYDSSNKDFKITTFQNTYVVWPFITSVIFLESKNSF